MLIQEIMNAPAITVSPKTSVVDAATIMLDRHISGLPVVDAGGNIVGIVSEGDFLRRSELQTERKRPWLLEFLTSPGKLADEYVLSHGRSIEEVMTSEVVTIAPNASLSVAVDLMEKHGVKRLPVVVQGKVIGMACRSDLLRALANMLPKEKGQASDDQIAEAVIAELSHQDWSQNGFIKVSVHNGVVELSGTIFDERERLAAKVAAENVPGVKSVTDQITWIDPYLGVAMPAV
ncbi:histidine kinase [Rhizobium dioscoreae]|uniref:Histidine kinase n=1 Tax=Rhizobium dioscoreae TaxID=2653122 RepID=A0ABQ0Z5V0_9HYPH|nr:MULTISPECIES: CBS domain-containing protein [Rhizobium]MCZ3380581.1 CBS domain-containing protein [Rhizobium sp. AG207R]GES40751.1 histidine kinase [Rhizobium dioscoreae]GES50879.1 histidine kinase [Rhizobium dioscoreae]GLU82329.1 histidine kinase [Rhizobium sp. NBRC 114257]